MLLARSRMGGLKLLYSMWEQELVDRKLVEATPSNFIAGRPKAALLFWFFGDFRYGVSLCIVIHVIYKYKKKDKNRR